MPVTDVPKLMSSEFIHELISSMNAPFLEATLECFLEGVPAIHVREGMRELYIMPSGLGGIQHERKPIVLHNQLLV